MYTQRNNPLFVDRKTGELRVRAEAVTLGSTYEVAHDLEGAMTDLQTGAYSLVTLAQNNVDLAEYRAAIGRVRDKLNTILGVHGRWLGRHRRPNRAVRPRADFKAQLEDLVTTAEQSGLSLDCIAVALYSLEKEVSREFCSRLNEEGSGADV